MVLRLPLFKILQIAQWQLGHGHGQNDFFSEVQIFLVHGHQILIVRVHRLEDGPRVSGVALGSSMNLRKWARNIL